MSDTGIMTSKKQPSIANFFKKPTTSTNTASNKRKTDGDDNEKTDKPKEQKKYCRDQKRTIKEGWFSEFTWLEHDANENVFKCNYFSTINNYSVN